MVILDDLKQIKKIDKSNMSNFIADLPDQFLRAYQQSQKIKLPKSYQNISTKGIVSASKGKPISDWKNIVICGLGGSAISGDLAKIIISDQLAIPLIINRDWTLPSIIINEETLVILVSYSGETRETLSCAKQALEKGAKIIAITSGGSLKKIIQHPIFCGKTKEQPPIFNFQYKSPPRAGLGYLMMPILVILEKLNLIDLKKIKIQTCLKELKNFNQTFYPKTPTEKNIAKYLAYFIFDHLPIIIVPEKLAGLGRRWKTQLAENSKNFSFFETQPEIFHNFVESELPWRLKDEFALLIIEKPAAFVSGAPGDKKSVENNSLTGLEKILDQEDIKWERIPCFGGNLLSQVLSLVLLGDWVSFYLAILNNIDPTPTERIQWLKKQLK